jgi:hypothetical protein
MDKDAYNALLQQLTALEAKYAQSGERGETDLATLRAQIQAQRAQIQRLEALRDLELGLPPVDPQV